jgi:hypothetical protein
LESADRVAPIWAGQRAGLNASLGLSPRIGRICLIGPEPASTADLSQCLPVRVVG